jgi:ethanolamine permease
MTISIVAYLLFTGLNMYGVKAAATFELIITIIAVIEIIIFAAVTLPHFEVANLQKNAWPSGWTGVIACLPFAIWFFLGIEGLANVAEEAENPQKDIQKGFGYALLTLVILCVLVFLGAIGVGGWEAVVYKNGFSGDTSDSPLPLAMGQIVGSSGWLFHLLLTVGLFGLVASFHGLILAAGRSSYELGAKGFAPRFLGQINERFQTPAKALLANMGIGIIALFTNKTAEIITISVMGALTLYSIAMLSLLRLRKKEPLMPRPFRVPLYPLMPLLALVLSTLCLIFIAFHQPTLFFIYLGILTMCYVLFVLIVQPKT